MTHLLIVDDVEENRYILRVLLQGHGYTVDEARHGAEALVRARLETPDLIISDLLMPVMDGFTLLRRWKSDEHLKSIPFVVYTATYTEPEDEKLALDLGADVFILKPSEPKDFLSRIQNVLAQSEGGALVASQSAKSGTKELMDDYSRVLIRKLEEKKRDLEKANIALQEEVAVRKQQEELVRSVVESMASGLVICDESGIITLVNSQVERMFGYTRSELIGRPMEILVPEKFRTVHPSHVKNFVSSPQPGRIGKGRDLTGRQKDGNELPVEIRLSSFTTPEGPRIAASIIDITERKRAEEALRAAEEKYRELVNEINEGIFSIDGNGVYTFANKALADIHGVSNPDQLTGRLFIEFVLPHARDEVLWHFQACLAGNKPKIELVPITRADGRSATLEITASPVMKGGKSTGIKGVVRDITERIRAEEELKKSEERYRALFEDSKDGVFVSTLEGRFIDVNPAGVEMLGYSTKDELLQVDIANDLFFDADERNALVDEIQRKGFLQDHEHDLKRKDGAKITVLETLIPIRNSQGKMLAMRGFMRDITHVKQLQHLLLQSQKIEAIGRLAGGVAHDFNNILMAISGYSDLVLAKEERSGFVSRNDIMEIKKAAEQGGNLTRQLLAFSRKQVLDPKILDLNQTVSGMENLLRRLIGEDVYLVIEPNHELGRVKVDPGQIEQVVMNLAVNARDAMQHGGKLIIETANVELDQDYVERHVGAAPGRYVQITVTDSGEGMDETVLSHIFEPFFTTKEAGKGTGLGLATVYGIVKQSGGYIEVYSEPGHGTSFKIYFPRVDSPLDQPDQGSSTHNGIGGDETILLVDDNESVRTAMAAVLEIKGYKVVQAINGMHALNLFRQLGGQVHLVITDVIMPGMSGSELAHRLNEEQGDLKVLFISGYSDDVISEEGLEDLQATFLPKPSSMNTLLSKIRELLDKRE